MNSKEIGFGYSSVGGRVGRGLLNAADTSTILDSESDVALLTPVGVPRVLNEPVFEASGCISAIADSEDSVVKVGAAGRRVEDT